MIYLGLAVYWFTVAAMAASAALCLVAVVLSIWDRGSSINGGPR